MAEELAGVGFWRLDVATRRLQWSSNMYRIWGLPPDSDPPLAGLMDRIHPEDRPAAEARLAHLIDGQAAPSLTRIRRLDGQLRVIEGRSGAERDADGRVIAAYGAVIDVTDHKRAEAQLIEARETAERAAQSRADFLANMSHEFRTPLTAVVGYSDLLAETPNLPGAARHHVGLIKNGAQALLTLVNRLLDHARIEAGQVKLKPAPTDMAELAGSVLSIFSLQAETKRLRLVSATAPNLPPFLMLDGEALSQVLINLFSNAVKFTDKGQVRLTFGYDADAQRLQVEVSDSGIGIAHSARARLFERFASSEGDNNHSGAGLGLSISKGLVEAMGGSIALESEPGLGSTFSFSIAAAPAFRPRLVRLAPTGLDGRISLLLADDNETVRNLVRDMMAATGARVTEACDGLAAFDIARETPFDVILLDIRMPGLSGSEVASRLRRSPGPNRNAPIVAFTADARGGKPGALPSEDFDGVLYKPVRARDLVALVAELCRDSERGAAP